MKKRMSQIRHPLFSLLFGVVLSNIIASLDTGDLMILVSALITFVLEIGRPRIRWIRIGLLYGFVVEALKLGS
nr:hypothetical protein [Cyanidioschyzonaceae sp. 2]